MVIDDCTIDWFCSWDVHSLGCLSKSNLIPNKPINPPCPDSQQSGVGIGLHSFPPPLIYIAMIHCIEKEANDWCKMCL